MITNSGDSSLAPPSPTRFAVVLPLVLVVTLSLTGCRAMSHLAHSVGQLLDPDLQHCPADETDCPLCGLPPGAISPELYGAGARVSLPTTANTGRPRAPPGTPLGNRQYPYANGYPGVVDPHAAYSRHESQGYPGQQNARSEMTYSGTQPEDPDNAMLLERNGELIKARADLSMVQRQVQDVRADMTAWRQEMRRLQQQLEESDQQRHKTMNEMNNTIAEFVKEAE